MTTDVRHAFLTEITRHQAPVVHAVLGALGVVLGEGEDPTAACPEVSAFYSEYSDQLMALTVVSANRLVRYELSVTGASLTTCVPLERVRRVAEASENGMSTVVIEMEAEPTQLRLAGAVEDGRVNAEGSLVPGGLVLSASGAQAGPLARFAVHLRAALAVY